MTKQNKQKFDDLNSKDKEDLNSKGKEDLNSKGNWELLIAILGAAIGIFGFGLSWLAYDFGVKQDSRENTRNNNAIFKEYTDSISALNFDKELSGKEEGVKENINDIKSRVSTSNKMPSAEEKLLEFAAIKKEEDKIDAIKNARVVARAQTLSTLRRLDDDGELKGEVIRFLHEAKLIALPSEGNLKKDLNLFRYQVSRDSPCPPQTLVDLCGANLKNVQLKDAWLWRINLKETILSNADFSNTNFKEADLSKADLTSARLINADLRDADLTGAKLESADLKGACYTEKTKIKIDDSKKEVMKKVPSEKNMKEVMKKLFLDSNFICKDFNP